MVSGQYYLQILHYSSVSKMLYIKLAISTVFYRLFTLLCFKNKSFFRKENIIYSVLKLGCFKVLVE